MQVLDVELLSILVRDGAVVHEMLQNCGVVHFFGKRFLGLERGHKVLGDEIHVERLK